ncbi:preprotein translocase subunit SecG, partial [Rhodoligotrophos defluvii]|uniref:preprotein translocase subunit SecG n=1 Tax=Rhodoligotrophos defluvii TaxID=2561934 RepID=UPI0010C9AB8F
MEEVILVIHLIVAIALVAVVLLQRSEGGALGIGGGGSMFASRGAANVLTRATAILAGIFFLTSIVLTLMHSRGGTGSVFDELIRDQQPAQSSGQGEGGGSGSVLPVLPGGPTPAPSPPAPAAPAPASPTPGTAVPGASAPVAPTPTVPTPAAPTAPAPGASGEP